MKHRISSISSQLLTTVNMGDAGSATQGKLTLYTNHVCPWAHRAHIMIKELGLQYDEVIIDLETPREEWYLKINDVSNVHLTSRHTSAHFIHWR